MRQSEKIVAWLKQYPAVYGFVRHQLYGRLRSFNRQKIFLNVYRNNYWDGAASLSGIGSSLETTAPLRAALPDVIAELDVKSLLDIPCGDFHWMQHIPLQIDKYIGADIVPALIEENTQRYSGRVNFICLDILKDKLPRVDAIFCRDCLVHLSIREVHKALHNIGRSSSKYLMTTTFPECLENIDTVTPYWRALNLEIAPFNLPKPLLLIKDFSADQRNDQGKYLGVWRTADLQRF
jgi:SAM-dependent methyltransferase